ncbi:MAG: DUF3047 domain-containing protein [Rhodospirillales bacterium]|nr:DUF3047 domain-containing protein [Rhodospirillales bacterium]
MKGKPTIFPNAARWRGLALAAAAGLILSACDRPTAMVDPAGRLEVLTPGPDFAIPDSIGEWTVLGADDDGGARFGVSEMGGVRALTVTTGRKTGILLRNTDAILVVAPYLSWAWKLDRHAGAQHPVRIAVGFRGGGAQSGRWREKTLAWLGPELPPYERMMTIGWDVSALRRGHMGPPRENPRAPRHYTVGGGTENAGDWRLETVDLSALYRQAWPEDDFISAKIAFIGIVSLATHTPSTAGISGLVLSR